MLNKIAAYFSPILLLIAIKSNAQVNACFDALPAKGCAPFTVTLDDGCATYDRTSPTKPQYDYDDPNDPSADNTLAITHTYAQPGLYHIEQYIDGSPTGITSRDVVVTASPDPVFTVQSCTGGIVKIVMAPFSPITSPYQNYDINWGDGSMVNAAPGSTTTHPFTSDGFKSITVTGKFLPNIACGSKTVTSYAIQALIKPDFTQIAVITQHVSTGSIQLKFNAIQGQKYYIQQSTDGTVFSTIQTEFATTTGQMSYIDHNLNTQTIVYYYKIVAFDDCGLELPSDPIYSIIIKATATNALNTVTWNTDPSVNTFTLIKNTVPQTFPGAATSFPDNAIACGSSYCYRDTAFLKTFTLSGVRQKSISIDTCITAISTTFPPAPQDVNSTINGSAATISWTSSGSNINYKLYQNNGSGYALLTQQTGTSYSYNLPDLSSSYCYQLDYTDLCSNPSPRSLTTCPVILKGAISGTTITLHWNTYTGSSAAHSYAVQKMDQNGTVLSETNVALSTSFSETVNLTDPYINYRIKVITTNPAFINSFSNNSLFKFEAEVFVPDIFTPNGDNTNDYFIVKGRYVNTYSITIFSRWGEVVYASTDMLAGWNGSDNFVYAPEGAYTYKIVATDINNKEFTKTGTVTLTR